MKLAGFLLLAFALLTAIASLRPPEYDESYSIFLTAGHARPAWPTGIFSPQSVRPLFTGPATFSYIAANLTSGDVHPPLYFWLLDLWRAAFGPAWLTARLLSVLLSVASLATLARLAAATKTPILPTLLITLLAYGFAYTGSVARGFALAQLLTLLGFLTLFHAGAKKRRLAFAGGLLLGAASFTNYLAIFPALAALARAARHKNPAAPAAAGLLIFTVLDAYFFHAQAHARAAQFANFHIVPAMFLLAKDSAAALYGGLPLYAGRAAPAVAAALLILTAAIIWHIIRRATPHRAVFALAAAATPAGLLALGVLFNNTPIEIRYLAFSIPYAALLCAAALPRALLIVLLATETCAIAGLAFAPATMQPQGRAAAQAATIQNTLILLPFGNDGVGIPGPFIAVSPDHAEIELLHPNTTLNPTAPRLTLITLRIDAASRLTTAQALRFFSTHPCYIPQTTTSLTATYLNRCPHQQP
jgi:hypothetical protein